MKINVIDDSSIKTWRTEIPNIVIKGSKSTISVHSKWLYVYLKSVAGEGGKCWQSTKTISEGSGLSMGQISKSKKELKQVGLIDIIKGNVKKSQSDSITIVDVWVTNVLEFSKTYNKTITSTPSPDEHPPSRGESPLHVVNLRKNPLKKEPYIRNNILVQGKAFDDTDLIFDVINETDLSLTPQSLEEKTALLCLHIWHDVNNLQPNNKTTLKAKLGTWYHPIRLMIEQDDRTIEEIWKLWKQIQRDEFWKANILSPSKLREQFDNVSIKLKPKKQGISNEFINSLYE